MRRTFSRLGFRFARTSVGVVFGLVCALPLRAQPTDLTRPVVKTHVDAVYPESALKERRHADVEVDVDIDEEGHVTNVSIHKSGGADLDEAAMKAARAWTFDPATRHGRPIAAKIRIPFHFSPPAPPEPNTPEQPVTVISGAIASPQGGGTTSPAASHAGHAGEPHTDTVTVLGKAPTPNRGASDFNLKVGELKNVPRQNAADLLKLAPGILLTNRGGEGHPEQIFLRGFDAREGQDVELSVGGVPINEAGNLHGNGYADTHFLIPELVESLRVLEGPFDPRQGNFAVAGSADYELGLDRRGLTTRLTTGSYGTRRLLITWGPKGQSEHTFGGAEVYETDGFGQNRDARRGTAMAQYEGALSENTSFRVLTAAYTSSYKSAGVLRQDDVDAGRKRFFDTYDFHQGGNASLYMIASDIESRQGDTLLKQQLFVQHRSMRLRENFTGFLLDTQQLRQTPHEQRGDQLDLSNTSSTVGGRGSARYKTKALGQTQELELGYLARFDVVDATQLRNEAANQIPYMRETDLESKLGNVGLYVDTSLRPLRWITARGGIRADVFSYDVLDKCAATDVRQPSKDNPPGDESCLSQQNFGRYRDPTQHSSTTGAIIMPRASLLVGPFDGFVLSASYGQGARSIDPSYVTDSVKTPFAKLEAYEGGVTYVRTIRDTELSARSVFFQTHVDRDLLFSETLGRNALANGTTRTGWVGAIRATGTFFDEAANITLVKSRFDDTGLLIPYVPDVVFRSDTSVHGSLTEIKGKSLRGAVGSGITYVGRRALPYGQRSDTIFTLDASASLAWSAFELGVFSTNLLDSQYRLGEYNYTSDFHSAPNPTLVPSRHFSAGAPRSVFVTMAVTVGGDP
ncbi:MAG: TonB family protein [Polyangiaceae bacterium]